MTRIIKLTPLQKQQPKNNRWTNEANWLSLLSFHNFPFTFTKLCYGNIDIMRTLTSSIASGHPKYKIRINISQNISRNTSQLPSQPPGAGMRLSDASLCLHLFQLPCHPELLSTPSWSSRNIILPQMVVASLADSDWVRLEFLCDDRWFHLDKVDNNNKK